jgi:hypothetical protein
MAWERRRQGLYFYRSKRIRGRVVKQYYGSDTIGQLAADLAEEGRARRAEDAAALRTEQAHLEALDRPPAALDQACTLLAAAELTAGGYRRHNHGRWTRRK